MENETFEVRDLREKEKFVIDDKFLNGYARFIGIYAVGVYNSIARHANKKQTSWPSLDLMAQELDIGRNSVIESIKRMEFFNIILKERVGKRANNRYSLVDKRHWKPISEVCLKDFSEVCGVNFTSLRGKLHQFAGQTSNSKETHSKETHSKEMPSREIFSRSGDISLLENEYHVPTKEDIRNDEIREAGGEPKKYGRNDTLSLLYWAEERIKRRYPQPKVQMKAIASMFGVGYSVADIKQKWEELENEDWVNGLDFKIVMSNIAKIKGQRKVKVIHLK